MTAQHVVWCNADEAESKVSLYVPTIGNEFISLPAQPVGVISYYIHEMNSFEVLTYQQT